MLQDLGVSKPYFCLYTLCKNYLVKEHHYELLAADEAVQKSKAKIESALHKTISNFEIIGLPSPYYFDDYEAILNFNHKLNDSEIDWEEYKKIIPLFYNPEPVEFLLLCGLSLFADGADKVIIVDGSNDGGIDIIAIHGSKTFSQRITFLQSKKALNGVSKEILIYEDAYFKDQATHTAKHVKYLTMLGVNPDNLSNDITYCFCTNIRMKGYSKNYARRHMIKIRVGENIAGLISRKYSYDILKTWLNIYSKNTKVGSLTGVELSPPSD